MMESSDASDYLNIKSSNLFENSSLYPSHHVYLSSLIQAENFFINDELPPNSTYEKKAGYAMEKLLREDPLIITDTLKELEGYGVTASMSAYLFNLLSHFTLRNKQKYNGDSDFKISTLYNEVNYNLPWVKDILKCHNVPAKLTENILKEVIKYTLTNSRSILGNSLLDDWSSWENLSGELTSAPSASCIGRNRLDILARGKSKNLLHRSLKDGEWSNWTDISGKVSSAPSAAIFAENEFQVFARSSTGSLIHKELKENHGIWKDLGGSIVSEPCLCNCKQSIHIFARGKNNCLHHLIRDTDGNLGSWENLGGTLTSSPTAVSWDKDRIDVFARGTNDNLQHIQYENSTWGTWINLGGTLTSAPCASSRANNRIDVFARGAKKQLIWKLWNGVGWSDWINLGGALASRPSSVSWGPDRIDVFARGFYNNLIYICNK